MKIERRQTEKNVINCDREGAANRWGREGSQRGRSATRLAILYFVYYAAFETLYLYRIDNDYKVLARCDGNRRAPRSAVGYIFHLGTPARGDVSKINKAITIGESVPPAERC